MISFLKLGLILFLFSWSFLARAEESLKADHIRVSLVAPQEFGPASTTIGIRYVMEADWHVYWKNPGDSGSAPKLTLKMEGAQGGSVLWPFPKRLPIGDLVNLGYEKSVTLPFEVIPDAGARHLKFEAKLEWLVCDKGECVPGFGSLSFERPVGAEEKWSEADLMEVRANGARVPQPAAASPWKNTEIKAQGDRLLVVFEGAGDADKLEIYPTDGLRIRPQAPIKTKTAGGVTFSFALQAGQSAPASTGFVLTDGNQAWEWGQPPETNGAKSSSVTAFLILLLTSFVGGIILNFMPCVLPVLTIKFLSLAQTSPAHRLKDALLYTAGVLITFTLLGAIFLVLRAAGSSVGWGFQLQSPPVVWALVLLFWLMALNFLGLFEFGTTIMNAAGNSRHQGAFATGILSVFIAAPCTGPFMGTALGAAATLPAGESLAIFFFLGLGLASPFLAVAVSPQARILIPRPGPWMEKLKEFFAFPLLATVIWLLWVLHLQTGIDTLPLSLGVLLLSAVALWWGKNFARGKILLWSVTVIAMVFAGFDLNRQAQSAVVRAAHDELWQPFAPDKVQEARAQGKPVFIDFTAAWCITCQFNKKTVLRTERVQKFFRDKGVALFEADWTKYNPVITEALAKLGRNSVPVYVFYQAGSTEARILPQILTPSDIEGLFKEN